MFFEEGRRKIGLLEENSTTAALDQINHRKLSILGDIFGQDLVMYVCSMWLYNNMLPACKSVILTYIYIYIYIELIVFDAKYIRSSEGIEAILNS